MADNTIALGVQVPDAMKNISGMLNFAGQAQNLKNSQQQYQAGNVALQQEQIKLGERKGIQELFSDPSKFNDADGQPDYNKLINEGMKVAPTTFPTMVPQIIQAHTSSIAAKKAINDLSNEQRNSVGQYIMSLGGDTPDAAFQKLKALGDQNPQLRPAIEFAWKYNLAPAASDPDKWKTSVMKVGQATMPATAQVTATTPSYLATGGQFQQQNPMAAANGAPATVAATVAPGALETTETGPDGQKYILTRSPQGTILSTRSLAGGPAGGTGAGGAMPKFAPGDAEAVPVLEGERSAARNILSAAPIAHTTNQGILEEIDKVSATGATGSFWQGMNSVLGSSGLVDAGFKGLSFRTPEERASSYDLVGKYLERNAIEAAKAMGPNTNAGLEAAVKANGSVAYNPTAIKKLTKLNDAIVSGAEAYQPGLEKAIASDPQRGVLAKRGFDQAWAQNFDPKIYMIESAVKRGDKATVDEIKKSLGTAGIQELVRKAGNLERLSSQGRL